MRFGFLSAALFGFFLGIPSLARADRTDVMMQYFEWNLPSDGSHWRKLEKEARELSRAGFTALWLPPATKGAHGTSDVGYAPYDHYDLGEFHQKGTVRTKYGTKQEYLRAIDAAHRAGISVLADVVMNHVSGADSLERGRAVRVDSRDRNRQFGADVDIRAWTRFEYKGRGKKYSDFAWRFDHFNGSDWAENLREENQIYLFRSGGRQGWNWEVDREFGNYDYLLLNDVDLQHPEVRRHFADWGTWLLRETGIDGFRIDAAKHMQFEFVRDWMKAMRAAKRDVYTVAEYWSADLNAVRNYIRKTDGLVSVFDFGLRNRLASAARERGGFDLGHLAEGTLTQVDPAHSVTFVDNHDTRREYRGKERSAPGGFMPAAYAFILLRKGGFPCVYYLDYFGPERRTLDRLLAARKKYAHGPQHDYLDDRDVIGWTREGSRENPRALAVVFTDRFAFRKGTVAEKRMFVGKKSPARSRHFRDLTGNFKTRVEVGEDGFGVFPVLNASDAVPSQGLSVWAEE